MSRAHASPANGSGRSRRWPTRSPPPRSYSQGVAPDLIVFHCTDTSAAWASGRRPHSRYRAGSDWHRGGGNEPAGAGGAAGAGPAAARSCSAPIRATERSSTICRRPACRDPRRRARPRLAAIRRGHAAGMDRARAPARSAGGRRHLPELHQHDPDRGDRRYRARARQAGGQQQPGGAVGRLGRQGELGPLPPMPELGR